MIRFLLFLLLLTLIPAGFAANSSAPPKVSSEANHPNIVWLVSEDNSIQYAGLYSESGARMPNIEKLAQHGLVFNHAFANAPVCSVARSTLITGCYAPRIGAQYHRKIQPAPMPEGLEMFPYYLRQVGYYTTNNNKEDYNLIKGGEVWDESSRNARYQNRAPGQPFFHVQNFDLTHEGKLHFSQESMKNKATETDPDKVIPFPYLPNTATARYTHAKYLDHQQQMDQQIGAFIQQLEREGLLENTFIFYYGDHGGVLPRSKGYVYESGLHVPLVVYVPDKWKHLVPAPAGSRVDAFVRFIDFAPTILHLAGATIPKQMDGQAFLGPKVREASWKKRNTVFAYADRFDEKYDLVRSLRKGRYKYIRNFQPFNVDGLYNFYRYKMLLYQEWWDMFRAGELNVVQAQFFQQRPAEQLFDLEKDPHEINNLADNFAYQRVLADIRHDFQQQLRAINDLSFFPEPYYLKTGIQNPVQFGKDNQQLIRELIAIADLQLLPFNRAEKQLKSALHAPNPWKRYWALIVCSSFGEQAATFYPVAKEMARKDAENLVRVRAAEFLGLCQVQDPQPVLLDALKNAQSPTEANLILNTIVLLRDSKGFPFVINRDLFNPKWFENEAELFIQRLDYLAR
ncbi:MAG: sulfatase-like hydrolase/transferase [Lewinellaceae bacterium]|nr:sulfatase-like hydrolase/transferase [Lewinellaceae bacterium]